MDTGDDSPAANRSETDSETRPTRFEYDPSEPATTAVVEAVADVTDRGPTALPPLYEAVDTDALDALLATSTRSGRAVSVSFEYGGVAVVVDTNRGIEVRPTKPDDASE